MSDNEIKKLSKAFKALSNPNRLRLFLNLWSESQLDLAQGRVHDCFLAQLLRNLSVGAPTVSHHIKELENAGLITTRREGKQLACSINPELVGELKDLFST